MRYNTTTLLAALLLLSSGCSLFSTTDDTTTLHLTLANGFNHDWVEVEVAGRVVVSDTLTSNEYQVPETCCTPAAEVTVRMAKEGHVLRIRINESLEQTYVFDASQWKEIGVRYDRLRKRVIFMPSKKRMVYEG